MSQQVLQHLRMINNINIHINLCLTYANFNILPQKCELERCIASYLPFLENPSCLQTMLASSGPKSSSHTVPHSSPIHTPTLPSLGTLPPSRRTSPELPQIPLKIGLNGRSINHFSLSYLKTDCSSNAILRRIHKKASTNCRLKLFMNALLNSEVHVV